MKSSYIALALLVVAYLASVVSQFRVEQEIKPQDAEVIYLVHWHLESGFREALEVVIADFEAFHERLGRRVKVIPRAIPHQYYDPWLNTNLVGGTAPDIMEIQGNWWRLDTLLQNFRQLDTMGGAPNRYNDLEWVAEVMGDVDLHRNTTEAQRKLDKQLAKPLYLGDYIDSLPQDLRAFLKGAALKDALTDGMLGGFNYELGAYYSCPTSAAPMRIFYNRDMIRRVGYDRPPEVLHEFFEMCDQLQTLTTERGLQVVPIAAHNQITRPLLLDRWARAFTYQDNFKHDWLLTGDIQTSAVFGNWEAGKWSFYDQVPRAYFQSARKLASYFTPGFMSMQRDQANFAFVQERSAMTISTALDASYMFGSTDFEVGVMNFPLPGPGDPHGWDQIADMGIGEVSDMTGLFGLSSRSENPELAKEFVQFISSMIWNERFNRMARMVPAAVGAQAAPNLRPFRKNLDGAFEVFLPAEHMDYMEFEDVFLGEFWVYLSGQIADEEEAYRRMVENLENFYRDPRHGVERMWAESYDSWRRRGRATNALLNINVATQLVRGSATEDETERYQRMVMRDATIAGGVLVPLYHDYLHRDNPKPFPGGEEP